MKDPAFLFYPSDFITGTMAMPFEERGKFITLLCYQHQTGRMSEETISFLVGLISVSLKSKFLIDENGLWYNLRLENETKKRNSFIESRRNNGRLGGRPSNDEKPLGLPLDISNDNTNGKPKSKAKRNLPINRNEIVVYSLFSNDFINIWNELLLMPKWKNKPISAIQKSMNQLSKYEEAFAIKLIDSAIAGNYQGIVFDNTDSEYEKWKKVNTVKVQNDSRPPRPSSQHSWSERQQKWTVL